MARWLNMPGVGVPRRFGVGGMVVIVTMFGLLHGGLQWLRAPPLVFLGVAMFFAGMAVAQMVVRGGRNPRVASIVMGAMLWPAEVFLFVLYLSYRDNRFGPHLGFAWVAAVMNIPIGAVLGYLCGCLVAGVVLLLELGRDRYQRWRGSARADEAPAPSLRPPPERSS